jgi:hypothetical protein
MIGNVELNPGPETYISSSPPNLDNRRRDTNKKEHRKFVNI